MSSRYVSFRETTRTTKPREPENQENHENQRTTRTKELGNQGTTGTTIYIYSKRLMTSAVAITPEISPVLYQISSVCFNSYFNFCCSLHFLIQDHFIHTHRGSLTFFMYNTPLEKMQHIYEALKLRSKMKHIIPGNILRLFSKK